jgi:hypothetical protein
MLGPGLPCLSLELAFFSVEQIIPLWMSFSQIGDKKLMQG